MDNKYIKPGGKCKGNHKKITYVMPTRTNVMERPVCKEYCTSILVV